MEETVTVQEAAEILKVCKATIYKMIKEGKITAQPLKKGRGRPEFRISRSTLIPS